MIKKKPLTNLCLFVEPPNISKFYMTLKKEKKILQVGFCWFIRISNLLNTNIFQNIFGISLKKNNKKQVYEYDNVPCLPVPF